MRSTGKYVLSYNDWSIRILCWRNGEYQEEETIEMHETYHECPWKMLSLRLKRRKILEVWTLQADNALRATGFIDALDDGILTIKTDKWQGSAITTNPPYIITVRPSKGGGVIKVICLSNIGVYNNDDIPGTAGLIDRASAYCVEWFSTIERESLGGIKSTIAAQSWNAFRHRFMRQPLLCHGSNLANKLEESSTYSGRAECYRIGRVEGPLYHYDVKSCYPNLLRGRQIPCRLKHVRHGDALSLSLALQAGYVCAADVSLTCTRPIFPITRRGITIWPVGTFRTTLCGPELALAMKLEPMPIVHRYAAYETDELFTDWCEWALAYRAECKAKVNVVGERVAKLLTNSLWGRFAKRDREWRNIEDNCSVRKWDDWYERTPGSEVLDHYRTFGGLTQVMHEGGFSRESVPIVTAFINSLGRMLLWELMSFVGRENVVYCATDSIMTTVPISVPFVYGNGLIAGLPCTLSSPIVYGSVNFRGIHHYDLPQSSVDSGLPSGSTVSMNGVGQWTALEPLVGAMKRKEKPTNLLIERHRDTNVKYAHGRVMHDGRVRPHVLAADD